MIAACLKWSSPAGDDDARLAGASAADQAALELALAAGEAFGLAVVALTAGPIASERVLRDALACGARQACRLDLPADALSSTVGAGLAEAAAAAGARIVICGDHSLDRGSGSVPAYIAHHLGAAQALGLVSVDLQGSGTGSTPDSIHAVRRLDGGRRELLAVPVPCVLSVEASVARLRRAPLQRALTAERATIETRAVAHEVHRAAPVVVAPYRPRARSLPPPSGSSALERVRELTDGGNAPARGETIAMPPREAAAHIAAALREWGYLDDSD